MNRRSFLQAMSCVAAVAPVTTGRPFATRMRRQDGFVALRADTGIFNGRGGTIGWLVSDDAVVVIDTQFPDSAATCLEGVRALSGRDRVDLVINTHHHGDHTGGNGVFKPVADQLVGHLRVPELQRAAAQRGGNGEPPVTPTTVFRSEWRIELGREAVSAVHFGPAHTGGDIAVHFERADVVHMGDLIFNRRPPFIDRPGGASVTGWIEVLEVLHRRFGDETLFIFGHAGPEWPLTGSRADLLAMRAFLSGLLEFVEDRIRAGASEDEAAEAIRIPGFEGYFIPDQEQSIPRCIRVAYQELSEQG